MKMAPLALTCPLCCNETFSSHVSLKYHILSMIDNLLCPSCNERCDDLMDLADHLGRECANLENSNEQENSSTVTQPSKDGDNSQNSSDNQVFAEHTIKKEVDDTYTENQIDDENSQSDSNLLYTCQMCNISFNSVKDHLAKYHEGEEVLLETDTQDGIEDEQDNMLVYKDDDQQNMEDSVRSQSNDTASEEEMLGDDDASYHKDSTVSGSENLNPITTKYIVDNGKVRKITEEEEAQLEDKSSIIEVHSCPNCTLQFPNINHFLKHKCGNAKVSAKRNRKFVKVKEELRYQCTFCQAIYSNLIALNDHMKAHLVHDNTGMVYKKTITMSLHECEVCNTKFPSFKQLRLHSRMHEPVKTKKIEPPVLYNIMGEEDGEASNNTEREVFQCSVCQKVYDKGYETVHMKSHEEQEINICYVCNRKFDSKENLEMHMKAHSDTKKFACSYCKKPFTTYKALENHVVNQCQKRQYECQYCGRRFARPHEKVKHERIHTGEKPHVCQICGKAFRVSYCLTLHMRTHSGTRPYSCSHCGKRFKSHSVYNHHMLTHSDERNYKCPYCPKAFKTAVQLAGHKNSHTKPFSCKECNRPFASLYAVRAHMETHKRDNNLRFDCWVCGASYARSFALRDHMSSVHGGEGDLIDNDQEEATMDGADSQQDEKETTENEQVEEHDIQFVAVDEHRETVEGQTECQLVTTEEGSQEYVVVQMEQESAEDPAD